MFKRLSCSLCMEERFQRLNIHTVFINFTCTSYTKQHAHVHLSSARARDRDRDRPRDVVGLPVRIYHSSSPILSPSPIACARWMGVALRV